MILIIYKSEMKRIEIAIFIAIIGCTSNSDNVQKEEGGFILSDTVESRTSQMEMHFESNEERDLFDMEIPVELEEYGEEKKQQKYPGANRPQRVYGNEDGSVSIGISLNAAEVSQAELPMFMSSTKEGLMQSIGVKWVSDGFEEINGVRFAVMRFWSNSPDGNIYNMLCATAYNSKLVMITFNFMEDDYDEWHEEFEAVKHTISFGPAPVDLP